MAIRRRFVLQTTILIGAGLIVAGLVLVISSSQPKADAGNRSKRSPRSAAVDEEDSPTAQGSQSTDNSTSQRVTVADQNRQAPTPSGHFYHALELIRNPNRDIGRLVELDPRSFPMLSRGFIVYQRLDRKIATTTDRIGLRFNRDLSDDTLLYDVMLDDLQGNFTQGTDFVATGQLAVRMSKPGLVPDTLQIWDVEPLGTIEGTSATGVVVRVPLVRFWHYHVSGLDASEPVRIDIPPQKYENGLAVTSSSQPIWKLPLQQRRIALDEKYEKSVNVLSEYQDTLHSDEARRALSALLDDAQTIRNQVHGPLLQAIRSGEIKDGQAHALHWDWKMRNFNAEYSIEEAADFVLGSEATKVQIAGYSEAWQSGAGTEFIRLKPEYQQFRASSLEPNCVNPAQIKKNYEKLTVLISGANNSQGGTDRDVRVFRSLHSQMLATELSNSLACYEAKHPK